MKKKTLAPIFSTVATLWDGNLQLSGHLEIWEKKVVFNLVEFKNSHLNLRISLDHIDKVEEYLIFDLARNGLKIQTQNGQYDLFVLEEVHQFKKKLLEILISME